MATAVLVKIDNASGHEDGRITLSCHVVFSGSDVYVFSDSTYIDVDVDPTGTSADVEAAIITAIMAAAAQYNYSLQASDIIMLKLAKGGAGA